MEARASTAADPIGCSEGGSALPRHPEKANKTTAIITVAPFKLGTPTLQTTTASEQIQDTALEELDQVIIQTQPQWLC